MLTIFLPFLEFVWNVSENDCCENVEINPVLPLEKADHLDLDLYCSQIPQTLFLAWPDL